MYASHDILLARRRRTCTYVVCVQREDIHRQYRQLTVKASVWLNRGRSLRRMSPSATQNPEQVFEENPGRVFSVVEYVPDRHEFGDTSV